MTEKHPPLSTETAQPTQSLPPLNPVSTAPFSKAYTSPYNSLPSLATTPPLATLNSHDAAPSKTDSTEEEEPYTIKCICGFTGDDGNTIYCETCDSWQHIECFYPDNSEEATQPEFSHFCFECKPRPLDRQHAIAYQKQRLQEASGEAAPSQKSKRPPSKNGSNGHKKKAKPSDLQINGHGHGHSASLSDVSRHASHDTNGHASSKKSKSHKSSQSVGGSHSKRSPSYSASRAGPLNGHPISPVTTPPDFPDNNDTYYSNDFLALFDQGTMHYVTSNKFASLMVSNATSGWLHEPGRMARETGHTQEEVFQPMPANIEANCVPPIVEGRSHPLSRGSVAQWVCLTSPADVQKGVPLAELNGEIGFQMEYCAVPSNQYDTLSSPLPFVFFHPLLPLYIDTRKEGSNARYVRRSCSPNTELVTYLTSELEYRFWLVSDRHISPGEQITLPWDFRLPHAQKGRMMRLLGLGENDAVALDDMEIGETEFNNISHWVYQILSRYGGCACDLGPDCAFARFHRHYTFKLRDLLTANQAKKKQSRKPKINGLSPTSTGQATNSRAASEGHPDDYPDADKLSTSSRSKPPSREITPAPRQGSFDTLGILTEPTDRDKRKVAMVENSFRKLEQQPRKKKRSSDGSVPAEKAPSLKAKTKSAATSTSTSAHSPNPSDGATPSGRNYVDAGTSRIKSGTPDSVASSHIGGPGNNTGFVSLPDASRDSSSALPPTYADASTQTDNDPEAKPTEPQWWFSDTPPSARPKRRVVSLAKRLLNNRFRPPSVEIKPEDPSSVPPVPALPPGTDPSPTAAHDDKMNVDPAPTPEPAMAAPVVAKEAAEMPDTSMPPPAIVAKSEPVSTEGVDPSLPVSPAKVVLDLRIQPPHVPSLADAVPSAAVLSATPLVQSPFSATTAQVLASPVVTPSPIKKKMSLSDYTKSRKAAAGRPSISGPSISSNLRPSPEDAKTSPAPEAAPSEVAVGDDKAYSDATISSPAEPTPSTPAAA